MTYASELRSIMSPPKLFISYAHADESFLREFLKHLRPLERTGVLEPWFDGYILPGDDLDDKIREALERADLIALLVSPDFLASEYCFNTEMKSAIERHLAGRARVIPVIIRDCQWQDAPFARLKAVPKDGRSIKTIAPQYQDKAWTEVAKAIEQAAACTPANVSGMDRPSESPSGRPILDEQRRNRAPMTVVASRKFTDRDIDDYRHEAFDEIARRFADAINSLDVPLSGRHRQLDANRFTATIYRDGDKVVACTIWIGGASFSRDAINYVDDDSGETNSLNESLHVHKHEGELRLQPSMTFDTDMRHSYLDSEAAAEFLWRRLVGRIG